MSRDASVSLTEDQQRFVTDLVESGRYRGASDVVRAGLRLLEEQEERRQDLLQRVEAAVQEGLDSGPSEPMEPIDEIIAAARNGG